MRIKTIFTSALALLIVAAPAPAAPNKGAARSSSRSSVNKAPSSNRSSNNNVNRNTNVNTNVNRNVNVDVDRDVDVHVHGGYNNGCCYHSGVGVAAAAVATAIVVGSIVNTLPPSCSVMVINGITYQQCGGTWYQPQFAGGNTTYIVVNAPR